jgi:hypothetical protein
VFIGENIARAAHWGCAIEPIGDVVADNGWGWSFANGLQSSRCRVTHAVDSVWRHVFGMCGV